MLISDSKVTSPNTILYANVDDEIVILDLNTGKYFNLNSTAAVIFRLFIKNELTFGEVIDTLDSRFPDTPREEIVRDVRDIAKDLKESGIFKF